MCTLFMYEYIYIYNMMFPRVEPDILISIHGLAPGTFPHFQNTDNLLDGVDKH